MTRAAVGAAGVASAGAFTGLLAGCSSSPSSNMHANSARNGISDATPRRGGSLVFGVEAEEQGFDPSTARFDETGVLYARTVFDPLTIIAADGSIQPYLAQSVTPNGDYTAWTVTARPGVAFHDGSRCDANAIAASMDHFLSGLLGITLSVVDKVSVTDADKVTFFLKQPWVPFPAYLAGGIGGQAGYVIGPSMIANKSNGSRLPVGTGPFRFGEWVPNDHFTASRNPAYWRRGMPYLDSITFRPISDSQARADALQAANIDIMHTDLPESIVQFRNDPSHGYVDDSSTSVGEPDMNFVMLNLSTAPFNDFRVRQAMAMAIDRAQYSRILDKGVNPPADQPFVPGSPYHASDSGYPPNDPVKARQLISEVQRETGKPVTFTLTSATSAYSMQIAQYIQNQLQAIGVQLQISTVQQAQEINEALAGNFQALLWRQFAAIDPDLNYLFWSPTEIFPSIGLAPNFARNSDPKMETLLQQGRRSTDPSVRAQAYQQVARLMNKDLPYIWGDRTTWAVVARSRVENFNNATTPNGAKAYGMIVGTVWTPQIWLST